MKFSIRPELAARLRPLKQHYDRLRGRQAGSTDPYDPAEDIREMRGRGILMFSFTRSGTSIFSRFLASHPQIRSHGEVLNERSVDSFFRDVSWRRLPWHAVTPALMEREFYRYLARRVQQAGGERCVFDLKIQSLHMIDGNWRMPGPNFKIFGAIRRTDAPVVLLERRDLVRRHLSSQLAQRRERFHSFTKARRPEPEPFTIDTAALEREIALIRAQYATIRTIFADHPHFVALTYEDLLVAEDPGSEPIFSAEIAERMSSLLGVGNDFDRRPRLQKMAPPHYRDLVINYDAVEVLRQRVLASYDAVPG